MKIIISAILLTLCISGCADTKIDKSNSQKENEIRESTVAPGYRLDEDVLIIESRLDLSINISDGDELFNTVGVVAVVHIDSIDGGDNYSSISNQYMSPYTYGKMTVQEVYKGDIIVGTQVAYYRLGGTISYDKYYAGLTLAQKEKLDYAIETGEHKASEYVKTKYIDDIDIEVGKTYLIYADNDNWYSKERNGYAITGFQGGLREIQGDINARTSLKVYNNFTKQWDTIEQVLPK